MKTKSEKLRDFLNSLDCEIDLAYFADSSQIETFDDLEQAIEDGNGFDVEIIYYSNAMKYLSENDASLKESLEIANDLGYEPKNLNSEILASLLASQNAREQFYELQGEIEDFLQELNDDEE